MSGADQDLGIGWPDILASTFGWLDSRLKRVPLTREDTPAIRSVIRWFLPAPQRQNQQDSWMGAGLVRVLTRWMGQQTDVRPVYVVGLMATA